MDTNNIYGLIRKCLINNKDESVLRARKKLMILLRDNFQCVNCSSSLDLTIDHCQKMDKKIINLIIDNFAGGPVGIKTIGVALGEEQSTLEEVYEPYLIMLGFIKRTPRGREVTKIAYEHMGKIFPNKLGELK